MPTFKMDTNLLRHSLSRNGIITAGSLEELALKYLERIGGAGKQTYDDLNVVMEHLLNMQIREEYGLGGKVYTLTCPSKHGPGPYLMDVIDKLS